MNRVAVIVVLSLILVAGGCAPFREKQADQALRRADYRSAFSLLKGPARRGHASAQHRIGVMLLTGQGRPKNDEKAAYWLRKGSGAS